MALVLKDIYEKRSEYTAFYTGGQIEWSADGGYLLCQCNDVIQIVDINSCSTVSSIGSEVGEEDSIYTFALSNNNENVATAHKSGLIRIWDKSNGNQLKVWRSNHKGPIARLTYDPRDDHLASGGSDGAVRLWDLAHNTCISSLKGAMGVFSVLKYHPNNELVFGAADDTKIRSWNSKTGKDVQIYPGHFSKVTSIQFTLNGENLVSAGRDRVIIFWNLNDGVVLKTIPVYECIEGIFLLPETFEIPLFQKKLDTKGIYVACAGEKGVVKVWDVKIGKLMYEQSNSLVSPAPEEEGGLAVTSLLYNETRNKIAIVTVDHNIIIHNLETFECEKQMIGFTDEILDVIYLGQDQSHIVVATNSADIKYYDIETMDCQILKGHTDIVLSLAAFPINPDMFVSSGKDNSVRVWLKTKCGVTCIGVGTRHTASVGSVCTSQLTNSFFASVSQDNCLKIWTLPDDISVNNQAIKTSHTELAHQSDINSVTISPNDKMIATGSQDKTVKLWATDLSLLGVLRGHRRGVWCVRFSPVDQVIISCSADCSIKLWSIAELSCLKTFEGHESSVLKLDFLSKGQQIISSGADGLLKLWNIKSSECKMSADNHDGKVWSLAVSKDESYIITGGSDSKLVVWRDITLERKEQLAKEREELVLQEQELMNLVHDKKLVKALKLAIRLNRPFSALKIINEVLKGGTDKLYDTLKEINETQKETLLKFASEWNTNNKTCHAAQIVFHILAPQLISGHLKVPGIASFIEGALPYSERHFERLTGLLQDLNFITYTVNCMEVHSLKE